MAKKQESSDSSSEEEVKVKAPAKTNAKAATPAKKQAKVESDSDSSSEEEVKKPVKAAAPAKKDNKPAQKKKEESESSSEEEAPKKKAAAPAKKEESDSESSEEEAPKKDTKRKQDQQDGAPAKKAKSNGAAGGDYTQLTIENLSFSIDDDAIRAFFADVGTLVKIDWIEERGRFSGRGTVEFETAEQAQAALAKHGADLMGRDIVIKPPRHAVVKPAGVVGLFVGRCPPTIDDDKLKAAFKEAGEIVSIRWATDRETGEFKGNGWADFESEEACQAAYAMGDDIEVDGQKLKIDYATPRTEGGGGGGGRGGRGGGRGGGGRGGRGGRGGGGRGGGRGRY